MSSKSVRNEQYTHKDFIIQGVKVRTVFPKANGQNDIMATVKKMLVHSHVRTSAKALGR